jgi:hypothetical protein
MKVVVYNQEGIVTQVIVDVYDPKIDRENGVVTTSQGKIERLDEPNRNFILVEDHIPTGIGFEIEPIKDYDVSDKYDSFTLEDVKEKIEEVGDNIKKEIKDLLKDDKKE